MGDDEQSDNEVSNNVSPINCFVLDAAMMYGTEYVQRGVFNDDEGGGGDDDLDDRVSGEEGPRGLDVLGLEKGRARERRLGDDGRPHSSKCTRGKVVETQGMGIIQSEIHAGTLFNGETGILAVARTGSRDE